MLFSISVQFFSILRKIYAVASQDPKLSFDRPLVCSLHQESQDELRFVSSLISEVSDSPAPRRLSTPAADFLPPQANFFFVCVVS
jgi:hypothetical protein